MERRPGEGIAQAGAALCVRDVTSLWTQAVAPVTRCLGRIRGLDSCRELREVIVAA
jgi:hypothetical protein